MKNFFLLLVLLLCFVAYMRDQQPETWNSWVASQGMKDWAVTLQPAAPVAPTSESTASVSAASSAPSAPPAPARVPPVGGLLRDGNFTAGNRYWDGDGRPDPSGQGLVVTLSPSSWTRVYQTFAGDGGRQHSIEVTYRLSPGLSLSQNPADYANISSRLRIAGFERYRSLNIPVGDFYGTLGDPDSNVISMEIFSPHQSAGAIQDYQHAYPPVAPGGNKTFALAFPPGSGSVTLLTAYVVSH